MLKLNGGTDSDAARLMNDASEFSNGHVLMVLNGRNTPPPAEAADHARAIFANPAVLGKFLCHVADTLETRPSLKSLYSIGNSKILEAKVV